MKFGKTIQSQQVPGWGEYYLNYKALKKIINSYAAGRPASDASLLSLGLRPARLPVAITDTNTTSSLPNSSHPPSSSDVDTDAEHVNIQDLEPLPPQTAPPGNTSSGLMGRNPMESAGRSESFKAHRDVFFFTLQRELEKINAFYLIKERDLRLRLLSLLSNRKRLLQNSSSTTPDTSDGLPPTGARRDAEWASLEEGWRLFERDLGKLQGFIEINATGFRKILKKWDKRSKSNTKELYLERQVEVQPCFNREFIAKLSDIVAANLIDVENGSEHLSTAFLERDPSSFSGANFASTDVMAGGVGVGSNRSVDFDIDSTRALALDALADLEANLIKAISAGHDALIDWVKVAHARQQRQRLSQSTTDPSLMRILWQCALHAPPTLLPFVLSSLELDYNCIDNINGRSILHKACIVGSLPLVERCVENSPGLVEKNDVYERRPLHYAAMHGFAEIVSFLLQTSSNSSAADHRESAEPSPTDMDGYTPLMHAIQRGHLAVVQIFVSDEITDGDRERITLEPTAMSNDLIPLSLACEHGHVEVARLLLQRGARVIPNSEGLYPQHLAAKAGHSAICQLLVEEGGEEGGGKDRKDKYNLWTPLHHAAIGGEERHLECVKVLVEKGGCDVNVPDEYGKSAGWYAAWFGHVECLNYLRDHGARLGGSGGGDVTATGTGGAGAQVGRRREDGEETEEEMEVDEMGGLGLAADPQMGGLSPGSDLELDPPAEEFELIPSLSLPPPIIPLRVYGHEFLAQRCLIQLSLGHRITSSFPPCNSNTPAHTHSHAPAIKLYSRSGSGQETLHLWSSLKLVMTSKSDISAVPHSVILPLADEREVFSFHAQDLDRFTLELSLYPTFGSKVIGRAILLPGTWKDIKYHKQLQAPLLDHNLKAIGEVALEVSCITPFEGAQLEIGGRVETYWKSKVVKGDSAQDHAHLAPNKPLSVFSSSGAVAGAIGAAAAGAVGHGVGLEEGKVSDVGVSSGADTGMSTVPAAGAASGGGGGESALVTASSLSGEYVHVVVQVTKDGVPVVYPHGRLPVKEFDLGVSDVTYDQFMALATRLGLALQPPSSLSYQSTASDWYNLLSSTLASLTDVLTLLPHEIGINLRLRYTREVDSSSVGKKVGRESGEVNKWVDTVLDSVYEVGKKVGGEGGKARKIIFSSFDPVVCTALNWKQPNYAVFFASYCGVSRQSSLPTSTSIRSSDRDTTHGPSPYITGEHGQGGRPTRRLIPAPREEESDVRCLSVREAVNFAKSRNLLGVILEASTLSAVPSLVASVKDAGLLLAAFGEPADISVLRQGADDGRTIDAFVLEGIMTLTI